MKRIIHLIIALLLLSVEISFCGINGSIQGSITDEQGEAIFGVSIEILGTKLGALSDINGNFSINNISPGKYDIKFSMLNYSDYMIKVEIEVNKALNIEILMAKQECPQKSDSAINIQNNNYRQTKVPDAIDIIQIKELNQNLILNRSAKAQSIQDNEYYDIFFDCPECKFNKYYTYYPYTFICHSYYFTYHLINSAEFPEPLKYDHEEAINSILYSYEKCSLEKIGWFNNYWFPW